MGSTRTGNNLFSYSIVSVHSYFFINFKKGNFVRSRLLSRQGSSSRMGSTRTVNNLFSYSSKSFPYTADPSRAVESDKKVGWLFWGLTAL